MREILFRGLDSKGSWYYGFYLEERFFIPKPNRVNDKYTESFIFDSISHEKLEVKPETVSQYTGYVIRDDKAFFGDLVSNNYGTDKEVIREIVIHKGQIMLKRVKGNSRLGKYILLDEFYQLNFRIIGNIHEAKQ